MVLAQKQKCRPMEQDRKPRYKPMYLWVSFFVVDKGGKNIQWRKQSLQQVVLGKLVNCVTNRMKLEHFLTPYTNINSDFIKDLNVRPETIKILEENIGRALSNINHSKILYNPPPRGKEIKTKTTVT